MMNFNEANYYMSVEDNGWKSKYSQVIRFDGILNVIYQHASLYNIDTKNSTVLDIGCGNKSLEKYIPNTWKYTGIDKRSGTDVFNVDDEFLSTFDFRISSGGLSFFDYKTLMELIDKLVKSMKKKCDGLIFNLLDEVGSEKVVEGLCLWDKSKIWSDLFNKYRLDNEYKLYLSDSYLPDKDFTIGIFKL